MKDQPDITRKRDDTRRLTFSVDQTVLNCFDLICKRLHMRRDAYVDQVLPAEISRLCACEPGDPEGLKFLERVAKQKLNLRTDKLVNEKEMRMERQVRRLMRDIDLISEKNGVPKLEMASTQKQLATTTLFSPVLSATTAVLLRETLKSRCVSPGYFLSYFLRGLSIQLLPAAFMASSPYTYKLSEIQKFLNDDLGFEAESWDTYEERSENLLWQIDQVSTEAKGTDMVIEESRLLLECFYNAELRRILIEKGKVTDLRAAASKLLEQEHGDRWNQASEHIKSEWYYQQIIFDKASAEEFEKRYGKLGPYVLMHRILYSIPGA